MKKARTGIILVNLGTPDAPEAKEVRAYLREFLMDPRVINMPKFFRALLVYGIILPFRPKRSAEAYRKVWTPEGSPLLVAGENLCRAVAEELGEDYQVSLAMRYGNPNLKSAIEKALASGLDKILIVPLYPQYAGATTGSTVARVFEILGDRFNVPPVSIMPDFYDEPNFIAAFSEILQPQWQAFDGDHLLFSFHGLPESQLLEDKSPCLKSADCCAQVAAGNRYCYKAQCYGTAHSIAAKMGLSKDQYSVSFQSRLGRAKWIEPYTTDKVEQLKKQGVKRLAVACPAFVADCLETLEEIGMALKEDFDSPEHEMKLLSSLNSEPVWVKALAKMIAKHS